MSREKSNEVRLRVIIAMLDEFPALREEVRGYLKSVDKKQQKPR